MQRKRVTELEAREISPQRRVILYVARPQERGVAREVPAHLHDLALRQRVDALALLPDAPLAAYGRAGAGGAGTSCISVCCGHSATSIVPIVGGAPKLDAAPSAGSRRTVS